MRSTICARGKAATKQLFKAMSDARRPKQLHQLARHGNRSNGHPSFTRACICRSRSVRRYARSRSRSVSKSTTLCWRGSIWHCGGVGMRRLRASRLGKSGRARFTSRRGDQRPSSPIVTKGSDTAVALLGWLAMHDSNGVTLAAHRPIPSKPSKPSFESYEGVRLSHPVFPFAPLLACRPRIPVPA